MDRQTDDGGHESQFMFLGTQQSLHGVCLKERGTSVLWNVEFDHGDP